jgi:hypothetical protein
MAPWQEKAHRLIGAMCAAENARVNKGRKRHKPYAVPADAIRLLECLDAGDEERAKAIFQARAVFNIPDDKSLSN